MYHKYPPPQPSIHNHPTMAKLIALALAFTALVAFASAHSTIITTTIEEESTFSKEQCSQQLQGQRFNQCQRYLAQGQSRYEEDNRSQQQGGLQLCCQELQYVDEQCQCEAVKEAFREAQKMQQQQQGQQGGSFGSKQIRQMMQKAQNLPNQCKLQTRQCQVGKISITTFTTITEDTTYSRRGSQQQCEHIRGRQFNQCQNFIQRQMGSYATLLMSVSRQGQQPQGLEQCCSELQNVEEECQCEAMQEVYRQAQRQQQQGSQQRGRRGGQPQTQDLQQIVQIDDVKKALDKNPAKQVGSDVENMLKTGRLVAQSTLDLKEKAGMAVQAERQNFLRFLSHFRAVHRGSSLAGLRATSHGVLYALLTRQMTLHIQKLVNQLEDANFAFSQNLDPVDVARNITGLDPETTLVVVVSKTFTTAETMLNNDRKFATMERKMGKLCES
ncbi:unnamed protein product [Lactuca virosa]|uniref:Bifunctional inhibitor/plant lipid transfer protein/seed storage helical domain-containing protein n=1 Tax=Lactuca virosa TaxID=75947 RepID=A0AAU9PJN5_9ASTR|nr:unnamed protein product [Lactuca virosa]